MISVKIIKDFGQNLKRFRLNFKGFLSKSQRILVRISKDYGQTPKGIIVILEYFVKILEDNDQHLRGF